MSRAQQLRAVSTVAERRMWRLLHVFRTGEYHFRKQVPIGPYFADIACHHAKLVIEVDGLSHDSGSARRHDVAKDAFLWELGYTVLRFTDNDVLSNPSGVFDAVSRALENKPQRPRSLRPLPNPPRKGEGEPTAGAERTVPDELASPSVTLPLAGRVGEGVPQTLDWGKVE